MPKKVMITGPVRNSEFTLSQHLKSINDLDTEGLDVSYLYYTYNNNDNTLEMLQGFKEQTGDDKCKVFHEIVDEDRIGGYAPHMWDDQSLLMMQYVRDFCIAECRKEDPDYIYMVDSDVVVHPKSLQRLIEINNGVSGSLIFKTFDKSSANTNFGIVLNDDCMTSLYIDVRTFINMERNDKDWIDVVCLWGSWLLSKEVFDVSFGGEMNNYLSAMEFKIFAKQCREKGINMRIDTRYPNIHLERSGLPIIPFEYFQGFPA